MGDPLLLHNNRHTHPPSSWVWAGHEITVSGAATAAAAEGNERPRIPAGTNVSSSVTAVVRSTVLVLSKGVNYQINAITGKAAGW